MGEIDAELRQLKLFSSWTADPIRGDAGEALKYWGNCPQASKIVGGEYQIVSMLTGLFWEIEHSAIYKPLPQLVNLVGTDKIKRRSKSVVKALAVFEQEFERTIRKRDKPPV